MINMELSQHFKSIIDEDHCAVVICDLDHKIIYMNPAACGRYGNRGGNEQGELIGYYEKHEYRNRETQEMYRF